MTMAPGSTKLTLPRFEDRLWDELANLHVRHAPAVPPSGGGRRRGPTRRARIAVAVVATAATAAAAIAVVMVGDDRSPTQDGSKVEISPSASTTTPPPPLSSSLPASAHGTADAPDALVVKEQDHVDGVVSTAWLDEATGRRSSLRIDGAGEPEYETAMSPVVTGPDGSASATVFSIDHRRREVVQSTSPFFPEELALGFGEDDILREQVATGALHEDGTEIIDGRELVRLVPPDEAPAGDPADTGRPPAMDRGVNVHWVEPDTYRPIKRLWYGGTPNEATETYTYLPRTPQNLALLEPHIPDGYQGAEGHTGPLAGSTGMGTAA
jgi:hypothetical protein